MIAEKRRGRNQLGRLWSPRKKGSRLTSLFRIMTIFYPSFFPREEKHNTLIIYKIVWKPLIDIYVKRMFHIICKWVTLCKKIVDSILFLYVHTLWRRFIGISLYLSTRLRLRKENWKEVGCFLDTSCRENMSLFI